MGSPFLWAGVQVGISVVVFSEPFLGIQSNCDGLVVILELKRLGLNTSSGVCDLESNKIHFDRSLWVHRCSLRLPNNQGNI